MKYIKVKYLIICCLLLIIEIIIALFAKDKFIRPILGDYLAVIFLFYLFATFLKIPLNKIAAITLLISYVIETLQYLHILEILRLEKIKILNILVGSNFSWIDIIAYTLATTTVLLIHNYKKIQS